MTDDHFLFKIGFILYSYPPEGDKKLGGGRGNCFSIYQINQSAKNKQATFVN